MLWWLVFEMVVLRGSDEEDILIHGCFYREEMERWRQLSLTHLKEDKHMHDGGEENIHLLEVELLEL